MLGYGKELEVYCLTARGIGEDRQDGSHSLCPGPCPCPVSPGIRDGEGRGRPSHVEREELDRYLRQSPEVFGLDLARWTLSALAQTVPSLKGMTQAGVKKALERHGYAYKRGQPHLHSPDPDYEEKKGLWIKL